IAFRDVEWADAYTVEVTIPKRSLVQAKLAVAGTMCDLEVMKFAGFSSVFEGLRKRWVLLILLFAAVLSAVFVPKFVWFYDVIGNERVPTEKIVRALQQIGVGFGTYGPTIEPQKVKNKILLRIPELQWITVRQNGGCAEVVVRERPEREAIADRKTPKNVLASHAGILTQVHVLDGGSLCKVGDVVQEGQMLVSAYTDLGFKTQVSSALAEIYAKTWRRSQTVFPQTMTQKIPNGKQTKAVCVVFGQKRLNIFGNSGNFGADCDKITKCHDFVLPGGLRLPITIEITSRMHYDTNEREVTQKEAADLLQADVKARTERQMIAGVIHGETFKLQRQAGVYRLHAVLQCEEMIARMVDADIFKDVDDNDGKNH
ncbi:MAG: sporulation protein YqfD, partial [Oscillospiraceae bacterium]|nr:sporulation protein YqfD [Oscillospiraceae bacterium]